MSQNETKKVSVVQINENELEVHHIYDDNVTSTGPRFGCRHVQVILLCFGVIFEFGTRANLSVAIVAMTDNTTSPNPNIPTYDWDNTSIILSALFWSYISLQILAGYLGKTYGPKYFLLVAYSINCSACALTPLATKYLGSGGVILCRIIQGFGQGFLYPSANVLLGMWIPEEERSTLYNIVCSGEPIGTITALLVTGYISASWWGWPASFYTLSGLGFCWCISWLFFGQNSPAVHPRITSEEKKYIQSSLKQEDDINLPTPWKKLFTCVPFYALMIAFIGNGFGYSIMATETPTYLAKVMNFEIKSNAMVSSIPTVVALIGGLMTGPIADWIVARNILSLLNARRIFHLIGSYGQAICLVLLSFLQPSQSFLSVVILALANGLAAFALAGCFVNHLDLSPRFAGIIYAFNNTAGQVVSIFGPMATNWIVTDQTDVSQWQIVFLIGAAFYVFGGTVFFFFASATRQPWDGPKSPKLEKRMKKVSVISFNQSSLYS